MAQLGEQRQAVAAQRQVFGIDHDVVEKSVDCGAQGREPRERFAVVALRERALDFGDDARKRFMQCLLGGLAQRRNIDGAAPCRHPPS